MFLKQKLALFFAVALCGCEPEAAPAPQLQEVIASKDPRVKFKGGRRLGIMLSNALGLPANELCRELGTFDCIEDAHRIALGGVEPYQLRFNRPLRTLPVTSLMAVERVVLSACATATGRDQSLVGRPQTTGKEELRAVVESLYRRLLQREVTEVEAEKLLNFYDEIESADPVHDWAVLACFAIGTSVEALFY